jgi:uncharacterized protein YecT (DUF1311 family)
MNLSTLSGPELRQLLDAARTRGQAQLTYQILQEMEARRAARGRSRGLFRMRRPNAEPRALVLDEPPEDGEDDIPPMPLWVAPPREPDPPREPPPEPLVLAPKPRPKPARTPSAPPPRRRKTGPAAAPAPDVAPPPEPIPPPVPPSAPTEPPRPRSVWDDLPEEPPPPPAVRPPPPRRFSRGSAAFFAVGMAAGVVLGVGASELWRDAPPPAAAPAAVETAALTPPPAPVIPPPAAPEPAQTTEPAPAATDAATPAMAAADPPPESAGPAMELPREPEPSPDEADLAEAPQDACAAQPTPADRTICGDPELQRLQRELRRAYARALDAHEDRDMLRQRQLAWRDDRSAVSNPDRLARLYEDRIRRLNAATEAARRAQ